MWVQRHGVVMLAVPRPVHVVSHLDHNIVLVPEVSAMLEVSLGDVHVSSIEVLHQEDLC